MKKGLVVEVSDIKTLGSYYLCEIQSVCGTQCMVHVIGTHHKNIPVHALQLGPPRGNSGKRRYQIGEKVHVFTTASNDDVGCWWDATVTREIEPKRWYEVRWPEDALDADGRRYSEACVENMRKIE